MRGVDGEAVGLRGRDGAKEGPVHHRAVVTLSFLYFFLEVVIWREWGLDSKPRSGLEEELLLVTSPSPNSPVAPFV